MTQQPSIEPAGADAALILFEECPSEATSLAIIGCLKRIEAQLGTLLLDSIPGWNSLLIHYDRQRMNYRDLAGRLKSVLAEWQDTSSCLDEIAVVPGTTAGEKSAPSLRRTHLMPVLYDGEDLPAISLKTGLTIDEIITAHQAGDYYVGAVGFVPGFAYMGGLDGRLSAPRRDTPRVAVPKGSVAIAEAQTSIYPEELPGGWNLIGRCPLRLYDHRRQPPGRFQVGDKVQFVAIDEARFHQLEGLWSWEGEETEQEGSTDVSAG
ncbi:5-oxoprolinase subunit B [Halomonadaceae bacterium LMG 33818]|uniref:5-oxoprolinase subunit B family protein n=1 Tax=Cernens ardua TaxID=3402176 RepID=UPI003EDC1D20